MAATVFAVTANAMPVAPEPKFIQMMPPLPQTKVPSLKDVSGNLTPEEQNKIASGEPMTITVNVHTGMIEKIGHSLP